MQAVLTGSIGDINEKEQLSSLFAKLDGADTMTKNSIENEIVRFGTIAIDFLIDKLTNVRGSQRGVAAMSLIRIGEAAIRPLRQLSQNKNFAWIANYLIKEIEG